MTTLTVTVEVVVPALFAAVSVYVVVAFGETDFDMPVTAPILLSIESVVAPASDHERVEL